MRAVVKIQTPHGGASSYGGAASSAAHYVAWDDISPEREGAGPRPLFTNGGHDALTYYGADRYLTGGQGPPNREDLIHMTVSFRPEDFEALGVNDEERRERLCEVAREAMAGFKGDLRDTHHKLKGYKYSRKRRASQLEWRWVAGVHLNTDNPHIHFLIHKDMVEKDLAGGSEKVLRVGRIPKELLSPGRKDRDRVARPVEGLIGRRFIDALDRAQDRARKALLDRSDLGMDNSSSLHELKFESPIVDRGIEYWTVDNYYHALKASGDALDLRRLIALSSPVEARRIGLRLDQLRQLALREAKLSKSDEAQRARIAEERREVIDALPEGARALAERAHVRTDWSEIQTGVLWTAVRHGFGPGTVAHKRLLSTGDRELNDGSEANIIGKFLMRIRGEGRQREDGDFVGRCRSLNDVLLELKKRNRNNLPVDRTRVENFIGDILFELTKRNPSLGGRELTKELIQRGPAPAPGGPPDVLGNMAEAFKERRLDETEYVPRLTLGDRLRKYSQELARLYENGAVIKDGVVVFPAEGHELSGLTDSRDPFITELRYAINVIDDKESGNKEKAVEFYELARKIAGRTADGKDQFGYFRYFYDQLKRDADGRYLNYKDKEARRQALERTLEQMRTLAAEMEKQESLVSIDSRGGDESTLLSVEAIAGDELERLSTADGREADGPGPGDYRGDEESVASVFRQEVAQIERMARGRPKGADLAIDESEERTSGFDWGGAGAAEIEDVARLEEPAEDEVEVAGDESLNESKEEDKFETRGGSFVFNTAARTSNLRDESLRFPPGLSFEDRRSLVEVHLPNMDAKIEAGRRPEDILRDISRMVLDWNLNLAEEGAERQKLQEQNDRIGSFLKAYVRKRLEDPETRALNASEAFRDAQARITAARMPEELIRAVDEARKSPMFNERERKLLFCGRAPEHHSPEMREIRLTGWLPLNERVQALSEGKLPMSPALKELLAELDSRRSEGRVAYFVKALKTPPDQLQKPEESLRLGLWEKRERLPEHELKYLFDETWRKKQSFAGRDPSLRETAPRFGGARPSGAEASRDNESLRLYREGVETEKRRLGEELRGRRGGKPLSRQEIDEIYDRAVKLAFNRLLPDALFEGPLEGSKKELSDVIARIQEEVQPKLRLATGALREFYQEKLGVDRPSEPAHLEALGELGREDSQRMRGLRSYAQKMQDELSRGFEEIDRLRREMTQARGGEAVEKAAPAAEAAPRSVAAAAPSRDPEIAAAPVPAQPSPPSITRMDSYREYLGYVAEIEKGLISEAMERRAGVGRDGSELGQADGLLTREDKLNVRARASELAWSRLEPQRIFSDDPAVMKLLALDEVVTQLRDETQPRAREAARRLDEFVRSRGLDRSAGEKTDYYYRGDKIPEGELSKLSPADRRAFDALEERAGATLAELKDGFKKIDRIRLDIDKARGGAAGAGKQPPAQITDRAVGAIRNNSLQGRGAPHDRTMMKDREILGDLIIAHARADCAMLDYETARDYGRTFRFNVRDESLGADRRISRLDVNLRAVARGERAADELGARRTNDRLTIRGQVSEADVRRHSTTLDEHSKKLRTLVSELGSKAKKALDSYRHVQRLAGEVIEKYQGRGEPLPAPFVKREELVKAQDEVVKRGFYGHTEKLERLRVTLADEHGQPARSDQEAARLGAQVFVVDTELKARGQRAARFDETRHLRQWEMRGEKLSLADIDRLIEQATDKAQFVGKREFHIFPGDRRRAGAEVERLCGVRQEVVEKIGNLRDDLRERVGEAEKLLDTLTRAHEREASLRERAGLVMPAPQFTRQELERAADNIETARDASALRRLSLFERQFNAYADPKERFKPAEGWGRAPGRAAMAEIFHRESSERLAAFERRGEIQPILIESPDDRLITHRLQDTSPQSLIEQIARPLVENQSQRELRHGVEQAFARYESRLKADFEQTRSYLEAAREIASAQAAERDLRAGHELPAPEPALTPKQAIAVEKYAERQTDPTVRNHFLNLARGSALSHFDSHPRTNSPEPDVAREVTPVGRGR